MVRQWGPVTPTQGSVRSNSSFLGSSLGCIVLSHSVVKAGTLMSRMSLLWLSFWLEFSDASDRTAEEGIPSFGWLVPG